MLARILCLGNIGTGEVIGHSEPHRYIATGRNGWHVHVFPQHGLKASSVAEKSTSPVQMVTTRNSDDLPPLVASRHSLHRGLAARAAGGVHGRVFLAGVVQRVASLRLGCN